jgi:hypothetical protein
MEIQGYAQLIYAALIIAWVLVILNKVKENKKD